MDTATEAAAHMRQENGGHERDGDEPLRVLFLDRSKQDSRSSTPGESSHRSRLVRNVQELVNYTHRETKGGIVIDVFDMRYGSSLEEAVAKVSRYDVLAGAEGAGFANQCFLPLGGGLLIVHGVDGDDIKQWYDTWGWAVTQRDPGLPRS